MSNPQQNTGCVKIVLIVVGVGLGFILLKFLYFASCYLAVNLFVGMDLSTYGRIGTGGWAGYTLLGLGLGAAGGAIAAQRRFRLNKLVSIGAVALVLILCCFVFIGNTASSVAAAELPSTNEDAAATTANETTTEIPEAGEPSTEVVADTTSQPADGFLMSTGTVAVWDNWTDSLRSTSTYLHAYDTVRLVRRVGAWVRVVNGGAAQRDDIPTGWVRLARLSSLPEQNTDESARPQQTAVEASRKPSATASTRDSTESAPERGISEPAAASVAWPTGHHQHTGQIGKLAATYSLDWQPSGVLTGSYYYDKDPSTIYRLTGAATTDGELRLVEFTRGRQSARCELKLRDGTYVGTMFNTDGRQFPISLE